jgi:hypothetical protein
MRSMQTPLARVSCDPELESRRRAAHSRRAGFPGRAARYMIAQSREVGRYVVTEQDR